MRSFTLYITSAELYLFIPVSVTGLFSRSGQSKPFTLLCVCRSWDGCVCALYVSCLVLSTFAELVLLLQGDCGGAEEYRRHMAQTGKEVSALISSPPPPPHPSNIHSSRFLMSALASASSGIPKMYNSVVYVSMTLWVCVCVCLCVCVCVCVMIDIAW